MYSFLLLNLFLLLLCSCWAIVIVQYFEPITYIKNKIGLGSKRSLKSDRPFIDIFIYTIWKILNCAMCMSYHLYWIAYLVLFHSFIGIILGVFCYFITFLIIEKVMYIKL